ncbi:MAG: AAA family ATPase, partial [Pseudomonadota bacterium]
CVRGQDDGRFFGFSNVARGQLQKATSFVLVPAVRDAATDAQDSKNTAVGQLMELIVRSAIQQRQDIKTFEAEALEEFKRLTSSDNLPELGQMEQSLSDTLKQMYADSSVSLNWRSQDGFSLPLPMADVNLLDDGLAVPVDYAGHGLQRAFIIALLQHLAHASFISSKEQLDEAEAANENPAETRQQDAGQLPGLILAIEEPELYQHPTKQRHFARVLHELSQGHLPGMATRTQMILATHSPHFAAIDRSDDVRILRRSRTHAGQPRETTCSIVDLQSIVAQLEKAQGKPDGSFTVQSLKPRLHIIGSELAEGFFAKAIVLVEGPGDRAALMAAAQLSGRQFEKEGIAVLPVGSKNNLDRPWAIFSSLDIPTYVLWDCDIEKEKKDKKGNIKASNVYLQKLMGLPEPHEDYPNFNKSNCACFVNNIETLIRQEIGNEILNEILEEKVNTYELRGQDEALKNPEVLSQILANADEKGARSNTLAEIIDHIFALLDKEDREAVQRAA